MAQDQRATLGQAQVLESLAQILPCRFGLHVFEPQPFWVSPGLAPQVTDWIHGFDSTEPPGPRCSPGRRRPGRRGGPARGGGPPPELRSRGAARGGSAARAAPKEHRGGGGWGRVGEVPPGEKPTNPLNHFLSCLLGRFGFVLV